MFWHQCIHCCDYNLTIAYNRQCVLLFQITSCLTFSWRRALSHRKQSIDLPSKSIDWFLYDRDLRHERVKPLHFTAIILYPLKTSKKLLVFFVFRGYRKRAITRNGLQTALIDICESLLFKISNKKGSTKTNNHCKSILERISPNSKYRWSFLV